MQATLFGSRSSNQKEDEEISIPKSKGRNVQLPIGKTREDLIQEREESLKCPICHELKPKIYDICDKEANVTACEECVIKRHQKHGYRSPGYADLGDSIQFYSQTTGLETVGYDKVVKVFDSICLGSPIFPMCIQVMETRHYTDGRSYESTGCYGVTEDCAQFLIQKLEMVRQDDVEFNKNNHAENRTWVKQQR
jgi:hypothetical protein